MEKILALVQKDNELLADALLALADVVSHHIPHAGPMIAGEMRQLRERRRELSVEHDQTLLDGAGPQAFAIRSRSGRSLRKTLNKTHPDVTEDNNPMRRIGPYFENMYFGITIPTVSNSELKEVCMEGIRNTPPNELHFGSGWVRSRYDRNSQYGRSFCLFLREGYGEGDSDVLIFRVDTNIVYTLVWNRIEQRWCQSTHPQRYYTYNQFMHAWIDWGKSKGVDLHTPQVINASKFFMDLHEAYGSLYFDPPGSKLSMADIEKFNAAAYYVDFTKPNHVNEQGDPNSYYKERREFIFSVNGYTMSVVHSATVKGQLQLPHEFNCRILITRDWDHDSTKTTDWYKLDPWTQQLFMKAAKERYSRLLAHVDSKPENVVTT